MGVGFLLGQPQHQRQRERLGVCWYSIAIGQLAQPGEQSFDNPVFGFHHGDRLVDRSLQLVADLGNRRRDVTQFRMARAVAQADHGCAFPLTLAAPAASRSAELASANGA